MASIFERAIKFLSKIENTALNSFYLRFPPENPVPALVNVPGIYQKNTNTIQDLNELLKDSILWAVPKKRRSIEKRRCRRFGWPQYVYKMLVPKKILTCVKCGHYHEPHRLCPHCYSRVMEETKEMQNKIEEKLGIGPVENEVVVLYENDKYDPEFYQGKRIVEMKKERPKIFSDNLLQKSMQGPADSKNVTKPSDVV